MNPETAIAERLDRLESIEAIRQRLHLYCRGIDRGDTALVSTVFWPNSRVEYGMFDGGGDEFAREIGGWLDAGGYVRTHHLVGNVTISLEGDTAHSEAYLQAFHHIRREDGSIYDWLVGGRYQDRFERRGGEWRIAYRRLVFEWYRDWDDTRDWVAGPMGINPDTATIGQRAPDTWLSPLGSRPAGV